MTSTALFYAILAGVIPSLIWLFFWLREDGTHPEPRFLLAGTFLGGMLAVLIAIIGEHAIASFVTDLSLRYTAWAALEEIVKFALVTLIALRTIHNDEPIDAMIYCITGALGFAALENVLFILGPLSDGEIVASIVTGNLRFIGATLVHVVSSAVVGFAIGLTFYRRPTIRICAAVAGLVAAIAVHAAFNLSIIDINAAGALKTFGWIWGAVVILIILFEEVKVIQPKIFRL